MTDFHPFDVVLLDIEGTTTPISFVYDVLFPYARKALEGHVHEHWASLSAVVEQIIADTEADEEIPTLRAPVTPQQVVDSLMWQMDHDKKTTGLKQLQGKIWRAGYVDGTIKGEVFDDVKDALDQWRERGVDIYIYSSGSVAAQKLLFGYSTAGDLTTALKGYFDTTTGPKKEAKSYTLIATTIGAPVSRICFATDNMDEARAAREAGMQVLVMTRPGNPVVDTQDFTSSGDFGLLLK